MSFLKPRNSLDFAKLNFSLVLGIFCIICLSGCTEYWWSRGQPPGVSKLLTKAEKSFASSYKKRAAERKDISQTSLNIKDSLLKSISTIQKPSSKLELKNALDKTKQEFINIENNLSATSRPAFGELAGQLRKFSNANNNDESKQKAFELFAARTIFFLARELDSPSPVS